MRIKYYFKTFCLWLLLSLFLSFNCSAEINIKNGELRYLNNNNSPALKPASRDTTYKLNKFRIALVSSSVPVVTASVFWYMQNAWWKDTMQLNHLQKASFHFDDSKELKYALFLDKAGHFWSSQLASNVFGELLHWAGLPKRKSVWYGAGFAILTSGIVEIKDGFAPWWGFSLTDMTANIMGSLYPVLQEYHPFFRNFSFKWSYDFFHKSYWSTLAHNKGKSFMDDYERHTYWFCTNINGVAPSRWKKHIPRFLSFDMGLSAENLDGKGGGKRQLFLAVGLDLRRIVFKDFKFYNRWSYIINAYRLPTPALKVYPNRVGYLLNF